MKIRIYFDPEQFRRIGGRNDNVIALVNQPNVRARIKAEQNDLMHLKAYADRRALAAHRIGQFFLVRRNAPG